MFNANLGRNPEVFQGVDDIFDPPELVYALCLNPAYQYLFVWQFTCSTLAFSITHSAFENTQVTLDGIYEMRAYFLTCSCF